MNKSNLDVDVKPIVFWEGFPACGLLLTNLVDRFGANLTIVATKPIVPFEGLEKILNHSINWIEHPDQIYRDKEKYSDRNLVIHTGWCYKGWLKYDLYVKSINNAKSIVVVDNRFKFNFRQVIGALYFRLFLKRYFDAAFVPGEQGVRLMQFLGMPFEKIYVGNYGAYEKIYHENRSIEQRNNEFLYVGQLNKRKAIDKLMEGFIEYRKNGGNWNLRILGSGELSDFCANVDGVIYEGFTQPHLVTEKMNNAKVLILISRDDHWGTVVCEAAACGMLLLASKTVGSSNDIIRNNINGVILDVVSKENLSKTFNFFQSLSSESYKYGSLVSRGIALGYNSKAYGAAVNKIIYDLF